MGPDGVLGKFAICSHVMSAKQDSMQTLDFCKLCHSLFSNLAAERALQTAWGACAAARLLNRMIAHAGCR